MNHPLAHYHYTIPQENIGRVPAEPRDQARLFVYDTRTNQVTHDKVAHLANYLPTGALLVMNDTGVIPARVTFTKDTGGALEALVLLNEGFDSDGAVAIIVGKQLFPGRSLTLGGHTFTITRQDEQKFYILPDTTPEVLSELLMRYGTTPTPYYLGKLGLDEAELRNRYQTIFAGEKKSVAAPTASLHFTEQVFADLAEKQIMRVPVTLHVGLGTFAEIEEKNIQEKKIHNEPISIPSSSHHLIHHALQQHTPIVAVGTTVVRVLESQASHFLEERKKGNIPFTTTTNIFIMPPYHFQIVDHLMTNFHVPQSSLMALVDAFLQHKKASRSLLDLYQEAIDQGYQFYSFGDSMLIL
jgi:S-adenosylmethionine:tRNA ribosyltransferase-isomerase